jgi:hypothetical protein
MATNLKIDSRLIEKAKRVGNKKTKREAVIEALEEYIGKRERVKILELAGTIDYWPGEDPVSRRRRERKASVKGNRHARAG